MADVPIGAAAVGISPDVFVAEIIIDILTTHNARKP
jgi:hypothetical protein